MNIKHQEPETNKAIWGKESKVRKINVALTQLNWTQRKLVELLSEKTNKELVDFLTK